jgi:hypothetical protein
VATKQVSETREANQGERMIEVRIRFWTNDLAGERGKILTKHAWSSGVVLMETNKSHGIVPESPVPFQSLMDLTAVIEKVLVANGITLHASREMNKYLKGQE